MKVVSKIKQGFTLIELMIVVAIIAILAIIAIPAYSNYTTKAKLSEVVGAGSGLKTDVETSFAASTNGLSSVLAYTGVPTATNGGYVASAVSIAGSGVIDVVATNTGNTAVDGQTLTFSPTVVTGANGQATLTWTCGGSIPSQYLPSSCHP